MTTDIATAVANDLFNTIFKLRPSDDPRDPDGNAWVLDQLSQRMVRAILSTIGPDVDPEELLALTLDEMRQSILRAQSEYRRRQLSAGMPLIGGGRRTM